MPERPQPAVADFARSLTPGGELALTSDYIYRGVSQSDGHGAVQGDLHLATPGGTFVGAWASSRDPDLEPDANAVLELYLGHRFSLSSTWSATLSGRAHYYLNASSYDPTDDYQEIAASLTYLDRWSVSVTAIPNAVRYWFYTRLSRAPAWVADTSGQWLLGREFFVTAGVGYYRSQATGSGIERATGYALRQCRAGLGARPLAGRCRLFHDSGGRTALLSVPDRRAPGGRNPHLGLLRRGGAELPPGLNRRRGRGHLRLRRRTVARETVTSP